MSVLSLHLTEILCENNTCGLHEMCVDTDEGFLCLCEDGYSLNEQNNCCKSFSLKAVLDDISLCC